MVTKELMVKQETIQAYEDARNKKQLINVNGLDCLIREIEYIEQSRNYTKIKLTLKVVSGKL